MKTINFEIQTGAGTNVEIVTENDWIIITEDDLIKMIRLAFDASDFKLDHLLDILRSLKAEDSKR